MEACVFCKIVNREIPSLIVKETNETITFIDINPLNPGHVLVCPKQHYMTLPDMPDHATVNIMTDIKNVAKLVMSKLGYKGFNILQNNDKCAGQQVFHVHFHVIPRNPNDGVKFRWSENIKKMSQDELKVIHAKLTSE